MGIRDAALAVLASVIWGLAFIAIKIGLDDFTAPQLTAFRFMIAALPVLFVPRPDLPWRTIVLIGLSQFAGQFLLMFLAFEHGMLPGLASVTQQVQAFFTVLLAAAFLHDRPSRRQISGMTVAFAGLAFVGMTVGGDVQFLGLALAIAAALSWAIGNVLVKQAGRADVFRLVAWCSLVPPLPSLLMSAFYARGESFVQSIAHASWQGLGAALYLAVIATTVAYGIWGYLLQRYSTASVAPFALLVPCVGIVASVAVFGESFGPVRLVGMAMILAGLAVIVLPGRRSAC